ncbi:MAG: hypothetical protein HW386_1124 [Gammaproteobacteria bacterium]|nr:hypothetical protein [Gammaproteobacteria bacterium]
MYSPTPTPLPVWSNFRFTGDSLEYFKIWIVNILLSIITIGLYSPWAKVRTMRYFHGNTWINDSSFAYLADPVRILKGRIIAVGILAIYSVCINIYPAYSLWALSGLVLLLPFILVTSMAFRMRNTAYRNIRFHFRTDYLSAYKMFLIPIGCVLIVTAFIYTIYLASDFVKQLENADNGEFRKEDMLYSIFMFSVLPVVPYIDFLRRRFIINQIQYGTARGSFHTTAWEFYKVYLLTFLLTIGLILFLSILAGIIMGVFFAVMGVSGGDGQPSPGTMGVSFTLAFLFGIFFYVIGFFIMGYLMARLANLTYSNTEFGPLRLQSHLRGGKIGWLLLSNTIAIICSLGLLIPWSKIRMARYVAESTEFLQDRIESITAMAQADRSAIGEEVGDMFDLDLGL